VRTIVYDERLPREPECLREEMRRFFQSRDPPRNALELSPKQALAGSVLSNRALPPPSTT